MKVGIFGGANPIANPQWNKIGDELGRLLVANDFDMVWGGNGIPDTVLGSIYQHYAKHGAPNTLVLLEQFKNDLKTMKTEKVVPATTIEDKQKKILSLSDAILVLPGGIGTTFEFWSAVENKRAQEYSYEILLMNYQNYWKSQIEHFEHIGEQGFAKVWDNGLQGDPNKLFSIVESAEQAIEKLKKFRAAGISNRKNSEAAYEQQ